MCISMHINSQQKVLKFILMCSSMCVSTQQWLRKKMYKAWATSFQVWESRESAKGDDFRNNGCKKSQSTLLESGSYGLFFRAIISHRSHDPSRSAAWKMCFQVLGQNMLEGMHIVHCPALAVANLWKAHKWKHKSTCLFCSFQQLVFRRVLPLTMEAQYDHPGPGCECMYIFLFLLILFWTIWTLVYAGHCPSYD